MGHVRTLVVHGLPYHPFLAWRAVVTDRLIHRSILSPVQLDATVGHETVQGPVTVASQMVAGQPRGIEGGNVVEKTIACLVREIGK